MPLEFASADAELAHLVDEFPLIAREIPLHYLAGMVGCSREAIERAEGRDTQREDRQESAKVTEPPEIPGEAGALTQWRKELRAGVRKITDVDILHRAACHEAAAREEIRLGFWAAAKRSRSQALETIIKSGRNARRKNAAA